MYVVLKVLDNSVATHSASQDADPVGALAEREEIPSAAESADGVVTFHKIQGRGRSQSYVYT
jgi:hypothetical protein